MSEYKHDHPDSDLFNDKSDYKKAPWPCVVVGGEAPKEESVTENA